MTDPKRSDRPIRNRRINDRLALWRELGRRMEQASRRAVACLREAAVDLRAARRQHAAASHPDELIDKYAGAMDERIYPPGYLDALRR